MTTRVASLCRLLCVAAGLSPAGQAPGAAIFGLDAGYPGLAPGPATVVCREGEIVLRNQAIALRWTTTKQGLKAQAARDEQSERSLALAGEVFQIVLADGRLGLLWRAVLHDGANYVRQELEITAREDCTI
ncbi:MAG: hypothetical protein ABSG68_17110, partial [Thermoguttaceae bacterium]